MESFEYPLRSIDQHNTEWMYYHILSMYCGHTAYEIYEVLANKYLKAVDEFGNIGFIRPTSLNTLMHNNYLEQVRVFASEFGVILPDPEKGVKFNHKIKIK